MKRRHDAVEGLYKEQLRLYLGFPRALQGGWVGYQVRGVPQLPIAVDRLQGWGRKERRVTGGSHSGRGGRGQGQGRGRGGGREGGGLQDVCGFAQLTALTPDQAGRTTSATCWQNCLAEGLAEDPYAHGITTMLCYTLCLLQSLSAQHISAASDCRLVQKSGILSRQRTATHLLKAQRYVQHHFSTLPLEAIDINIQ